MSTVFMRNSGRQAFKSRTEAMNRRRHVWTCRHCHTQHHNNKPSSCRQCNNTGKQAFYFFASHGEAQRFANLDLQQHAGHIKNLRVQVPFRILVRGQLITTYYADFVYDEIRSGENRSRQIVEDYKGSKDHTDPVFQLKKKLVEAVYGIEITITTG